MQLQQLIEMHPQGLSMTLEGIHFEFGNVQRLGISLDSKELAKPFDVKPTHIFHTDSVLAKRKRELEKLFSLPDGSISDPQTKVDILMIDKDGRPYYISYKDDSAPSKLGQVSRRTDYGNAYLDGGIDEIEIPLFQQPLFLTHHDTRLSESQFGKLSQKDRELAAFKHQNPETWQRLVEKRMELAVSELMNFGQVLSEDRKSFIEFIGTTLAGNLKDSADFFLVIGSDVVKFSSALTQLSGDQFKVQTQIHQTEKKTSLILNIADQGETYSITKIEPAFDGQRVEVSQTKGVIYYFQQFPNVGNNYKRLFLKIGK